MAERKVVALIGLVGVSILVVGAVAAGMVIATKNTKSTASKPSSTAASEPSPNASPSWSKDQCQSASQADWLKFCMGQEVDAEGSVLTEDGKFVKYPGGFTIRFTKAEDLRDNSLGYEMKPENTLIRITLQLENDSDEPISLQNNNTYMNVYYGTARYEAETQGYAGDTRTAPDPEPTQVGPRSKLTVYRTFGVPKAELASITVTPNIGTEMYTPFTFTDVGKLITVAARK